MSKKNMFNGIDTTQGPPWLCNVGLPSDGSVNGDRELEVFGDFMSPTANEVAAKRAMREVVQRYVRQYVSGDATVKLVGAAACGIDSYTNDTEMIIELPNIEDEIDVLRIVAHLCTELECELDEEKVVLVMKEPIEQVSVKLSCSTYNSSKRQAANSVRRHLQRTPGAERVLRIIRAIVNQMKLISRIGLSYEAVDVMVIAFLEHSWRGEDLLWVLRNFFGFYSNFDFDKLSVSLTSEGPKFVPKVHTSQLSVVDFTDGESNLTPTTILGPITATFKYVLLSIAKWDTSAPLSRGKSLLFNLLAHKDLWPRYMKLQGIPMQPASLPTPKSTPAKPAPEVDPTLSAAAGHCNA